MSFVLARVCLKDQPPLLKDDPGLELGDRIVSQVTIGILLDLGDLTAKEGNTVVTGAPSEGKSGSKGGTVPHSAVWS